MRPNKAAGVVVAQEKAFKGRPRERRGVDQRDRAVVPTRQPRAHR
ncbi:MAG: hypothetical protein WD076_06310 [Parvularculaceae bacterium]